MSGYTTEGLDNLLDKVLERKKNIRSQLENTDVLSKKYNRLTKEYEQKIADYTNLLDQRMDLYFKRNIRN